VEAEKRVRSLYNRINELSEQDRRIFDLPVEQRLRLPVKHQELWADRTLPTVNRLAQKERERLKKCQGNIWSLWATAASMVQHAVDRVATGTKGVRGAVKETNETGPGKTNQATTESMSTNQVRQSAPNATRAAERQAGENGGMERRHAAVSTEDGDLEENAKRKRTRNLKKIAIDAFIARGTMRYAGSSTGKARKHKQISGRATKPRKEDDLKEITTEVSESNDEKALTALTRWVKRTPQNTGSKENRAELESNQEGNATAELQPGRVARVETNTGKETSMLSQINTRRAAKKSRERKNEECKNNEKSKQGNLTKKMTQGPNPYSKTKGKEDKDDQQRETSNSVRTVLNRWLSAREPKFKTETVKTADKDQGQSKAYTQVGISRFFKGKTDKHP
jgi:hypothetical protein